MSPSEDPAKKRRPARYSGDTDDPDIKALHECFDYATDAWMDIRDAADIDMRFISGDTWDPNDREVREQAGRPCSSFDEFGQYVNQIINDVRQNKRAIKVTPLGNGANDKTALLRADLYRQIEYRSNAQQAYTTMFENAVQRSYGYLRVVPKYVSAQSRHQELLIEPIMNPDLVTPDPDAIKPDLADMKYLFLQESWSHAEFKKAFPKAEVQSFTTDLMHQAPRWVKDERILLAEWWSLRQAQKKLVYIDVPSAAQPGQPPQPARELDVFEADVRDILARFPGAHVVGSRMADVPEVTMRLTNGIEILRETPWKGQYIPFVGCFGKIIYVDKGSGPEKRILSSHRLAQSAAQLYSYCRTGQIEQVGMSTKFPYFVREGSLSPEEADKLQKSLHEPVGFITVKGLSDNMPMGQLPEMPVRNTFEPAIQALELLAEGARRAIQAGMGISPLPTSAQRRNEKSGVALKQIENNAQKGTFHFIDNLDGAITRCAVIVDDLVPHYYDAARDVTVRKADDTPIQVRVNDPNAEVSPEDPYADDGQPPTLTNGAQHDYTLATGPSYDSEREAANDFSDVLVQNIQPIAAIAGQKAAAKIMALSIKLKNIGALGNEMADTISPPEADEASPEQIAQENQQLKAQLAEAAKLADKNKTDLEKVKLQEVAESERESARLAAAEAKTRADNETKLAVAELGAKVDRLALFLKERARLGVMQNENEQAERARAHELGMASVAQGAAEDQAAQAQQYALEQGEQGHAQTLEQAEQQAALNPPVDSGAE